jgi:hypothetical protein
MSRAAGPAAGLRATASQSVGRPAGRTSNQDDHVTCTGNGSHAVTWAVKWTLTWAVTVPGSRVAPEDVLDAAREGPYGVT